MLDQVSSVRASENTQKEDNLAVAPIAAKAENKPCSSAVLVWLKCTQETSSFLKALETSRGADNFHFIDAERSKSDPSIWRCRFEETKAAPNLERRTAALLKRLSLIGAHVRAERVFQRAACAMEGSDDYQWDGYTRRPII